ncbi:YAP-binding/ALF4/Glomulin [Kalaharituber pfeilii]|nr:YAP-binding/ALF4/Glomulin [Kalaharituber pfeilii]
MYYPQSPVTTTLTTVTVEKAIHAIETAAEEIPADDFISYSTILDVHLSYALEFFTREEQKRLLDSLQNILKENDDLARNIAWDLISVLLPFLDAPPATDSVSPAQFTGDGLTDAASTCLFIAAHKGNPREVFLKLLAALSSLSFVPSSSGSPPLEEGTAEEPPMTPTTPQKTPAEARANGHRKLRILIMLLTTTHSRITTVFPSRFLSQSLTTLLSTFTRCLEELDREDVEDIVSRLVAFIDSVQPTGTKKTRRMTEPLLGPDGRPTLPPRSNTAASDLTAPDVSKLQLEDEDDEARKERLEKEEQAKMEEDLQIRLLQSFLSHVVEVYILRCPSQYATRSSPRQPSDTEAASERGISLHLASRYMKSGKFISGGVIESEIVNATPPVWKEVLDMAYQLRLLTKELQELCYSSTNEQESEEPEEPKSPSGMLGSIPQFAEDIPLSKIGSLILLASRIFEKESIVDWKIRLFPEHRTIVYKYLTKGDGTSEIGVLDAVLFLGAWALSSEGGGFGEVPDGQAEDGEEGWLVYLQAFALLSATSTSPLIRLLAHNHLSQTIHSHPDEAVRLSYIKDTLEHCPFESLKASMIGILKDEIAAATATGNDKPSIFASPLVLEELSMFLFPNLASILDAEGDDAEKWDWFAENYAVIMATGNLWLFLLMREFKGQKGVCGIDQWGERIEERWAGRLKGWLDEVTVTEDGKEATEKRGVDMDVDIVKDLLRRVEEVRKQTGV